MLGLKSFINKLSVCFLVLLILVLASTSLWANEDDPILFLNQELNRGNSQEYRYNKYEDIIAGGMAFLVGSIGYFTSSSKVLAITYSGIQSIGIINIGRGYYNNLRPNLGHEIQQMTFAINTKNEQQIHTGKFIAEKFIRYYALEDIAKRKSLFVTTSLLSMQFATNAFFHDPHKDIKKIYVYLSAVNAIIATFSYFYKSNFEKYYDDHQLDLKLFPDLKDKNLALTAQIKYQF